MSKNHSETCFPVRPKRTYLETYRVRFGVHWAALLQSSLETTKRRGKNTSERGKNDPSSNLMTGGGQRSFPGKRRRRVREDLDTNRNPSLLILVEKKESREERPIYDIQPKS